MLRESSRFAAHSLYFVVASFFSARAETINTHQFVRVSMDNQPANVRLFVMHGGVETFVELVGSAFQHAHSLSASSSGGAGATVVAAEPATTTASSGSEEDFSSTPATGAGVKVPRRERASDLSVALTCRELVVECISCLSSALEVRWFTVFRVYADLQIARLWFEF